MKKNLLKLVALTFVVSLSLTFTGCGNKKDASTPSTNAGNATTNSQPAETTPAEPESNGLADYLADPSVQALADAMSDDESTVELTSEGDNVLIIRYTWKEQIDLSDASLKETLVDALDNALEQQASVFDDLRGEMATETGVDNLVLRVEYCNADGSQIIAKDFE